MNFYPFEYKDSPYIEYRGFNFCCQAAEIGGWGGDSDSCARHCTYDEAFKKIKRAQGDYTIIVATTTQTQRNARRALKDRGFMTTKKALAMTGTTLYLHYWTRNMPEVRTDRTGLKKNVK
jgi:hypothetical protein